VRKLLTEEAGPRGITVLCFESRPVNEGRHMAAALAKAGVDVVFAVDAAAQLLVPEADAVLLGADSIGDLGAVNKIGSASLAQAARVAGVPVHVLADETKILPRGFPQVLDDDRPGAEVWDAPPGVRIWNRYFEVVPLEWVTSVVTDLGVHSPQALEDRRAALDFPMGLRAWAASRRRE
jgi:translation initiation factor 2B subunit (eIF-2B alpha/beta/delta family)